MKTNLVNGQNGVATSAIKNAVVKAVKMINKAENAKVGSVKIYDMYRLSFDGARFIKGDKDNFIFNGKIEQKGSNGRFNLDLVEIHYKNLDNDGLCLDDMVNAVIDAILNALDDNIVKYESDGHAWERMFAWDLQEFRYWYFGSRLAVDNADDLNSPDASDEPDAFIGLENASEECDNNMMACVDKYGQEFIDRVLNEYADVVYNAVSDYDLNDTIKYCVKVAFNFMEYEPEKKKIVGLSVVPDLCGWDDEDEFCNYFEDAYYFDWDSCQEFYQEYCDNIWHLADEYDDRMEDALRDFDKESVFDKIPYKINYDGEYIGVYIDMADFVDYIKKNMVFNDSNAQLFKDKDLGLKLYYLLDPDNKDIEQFYNDLISMLPMVTDVKLYDDGLYFWYDDMTIRKFFDKHKVDDGWGSYVTADSINNYVGEFLSPGAVEIFNNLVEKDEDWSFYIDEDGDGDLYVSGNEGCCWTYFDDNAPMVLVYGTLMNKMNEEIMKYNN